MNRLLVLEKVREVLGGEGDDYVIAHWERRVRRSDEPEADLDKLKGVVKTANEFWEWSGTLPGVEGNVSWRRNAEYTHLLLCGDIPGSLEGAKKEFMENYKEDLESLLSAFKDWVKTTNDTKSAVERLTQSLIDIKEKWIKKGHWESMSPSERRNMLRVTIAYELGGEIINLKGVDVKSTSANLRTEVDNCIETII